MFNDFSVVFFERPCPRASAAGSESLHEASESDSRALVDHRSLNMFWN